MSADIMTDFRGYFLSSSALTALVSSNRIRVGWSKVEDAFPCVILHQSYGGDIGYIGYNMAIAGSKVRKELATLQIDIYSKTSMKNVYDIADVIVPIMISGGCRKTGDIDMYLDDLGVYRKIQSYTISRLYDD